MLQRLFALLFPPKCILCRKILSRQETDLCHSCRKETHLFSKAKHKIPFVENWTAVWYYSGNVRSSLLRYKFYNARNYAEVYGRFLAMRLLEDWPDGFDVLTWVPISDRRRRKRGFDQVELLASAVSRELDTAAVATLKKLRDTKPQSTMSDTAGRRANVLGAYRVKDPALIAGKTVLLLDDIITTGSTVSECARTLLTAGAKEVHCAAIAAAPHDKK